MADATFSDPADIEASNDISQPIFALSSPQAGTGAILVMDDDDAICDLLSNMLDALGYTSVCAFEGAEAVRLYQQAKADGQPFAAVILDLHNTLGKGGADAMAELRALDPNVNAIICSGDQKALAIRRFRDYGFRSALAKPFDLATLDNALSDVLLTRPEFSI